MIYVCVNCFVFLFLFAVCSLVENVQKFKRLNKLLIKIKMTILLFFLVVVIHQIFICVCCFAARIFPFQIYKNYFYIFYTTAFIYYYKYVEVAGFVQFCFVFVLYISLRFDLPIVETWFLLYGCALLLLYVSVWNRLQKAPPSIQHHLSRV